MIKNTLLLFFICIGTFCYSQQDDLVIEGVENSDHSITLNYVKNIPGTIVVSVKFNSLQNTASSNFVKTISRSSGSLYTLKPVNKEQGIGYGFAYSYRRGLKKPKPDKDFEYLLPYKAGNNVKVWDVSNVSEVFLNKEQPKDWKAYRFNMINSDTICAIRKGIVVEVTDGHDKKEGYTYSSSQNKILIEHKDGTYASYTTLKKGKMMVKPGQIVFPQTPLGIADSFSSDAERGVTLLVFTPDNSNYDVGKNDVAVSDIYVTPKFRIESEQKAIVLVPNHTYTATAPQDIIIKEMSKRELKKAKK